jgi:hypothetical protein
MALYLNKRDQTLGNFKGYLKSHSLEITTGLMKESKSQNLNKFVAARK